MTLGPVDTISEVGDDRSGGKTLDDGIVKTRPEKDDALSATPPLQKKADEETEDEVETSTRLFVGRKVRVTPTGPTMRFNGVMVQQHGPHHKTINQAYKPQSPYLTSGKLTKVG